MIGQTVADMKSALKQARKDLIAAMGSAKRLEKKEKTSSKRLPIGSKKRSSPSNATTKISRERR